MLNREVCFMSEMFEVVAGDCEMKLTFFFFFIWTFLTGVYVKLHPQNIKEEKILLKERKRETEKKID